nr:hypothetical protein OG781_09520 [Streptomyces sp. NBC_00830]
MVLDVLDAVIDATTGGEPGKSARIRPRCQHLTGRVLKGTAVNLRDGDTVRRERLLFALGEDALVTLQPEAHFAPFDKALARMRRQPHLAESAHGVTRCRTPSTRRKSGPSTAWERKLRHGMQPVPIARWRCSRRWPTRRGTGCCGP